MLSDSDCMDSSSWQGVECEVVDRLMDGASLRVGTLVDVAAGCLFWGGRGIFILCSMDI